MDKQTVKSLIENYLENSETTFVNNIDNFIIMAEDDIWSEIKSSRAKFETLGGAFTAESPYVVLSSFEAKNIVSFRVSYQDTTKDGPYITLQQRDYEWVFESYPDLLTTPVVSGYSSYPRYYCYDSNDINHNDDEINLIVAPLPDDTYRYVIRYIRTPASLTSVADNEETQLSRLHPMAIVYGAITHGYIYEKGDPEVMNSYESKFQMAKAQFRSIVERDEHMDEYLQGTPGGN